MTNREYIQTLDNTHFLKAVNAFYFRYPLWIEKDYILSTSIPDNKDLSEWLDKPYNSKSPYWKYILGD